MIINRTAEFKRNYKKLQRKHYNMDKLKKVIELIVSGNTKELVYKHKDHQLKGKYKALRELHVDRSYNDNWILVYQIRNDQLDLHILDLLQTGDHDHVLR